MLPECFLYQYHFTRGLNVRPLVRHPLIIPPDYHSTRCYAFLDIISTRAVIRFSWITQRVWHEVSLHECVWHEVSLHVCVSDMRSHYTCVSDFILFYFADINSVMGIGQILIIISVFLKISLAWRHGRQLFHCFDESCILLLFWWELYFVVVLSEFCVV